MDMNVSNVVGGHNPYTVNQVESFKSANYVKRVSPKNQTIDKGKIEAGSLSELAYVDEKKKEYMSYLTEYENGLTNNKGLGGGLLDTNLEDMYKYSMEQFDKIENSNDDEETKIMRRTALEETLKRATYFWTGNNLARTYKVDIPNAEKDKQTMMEMRILQNNQFNAVINSTKKLTSNFMDYIKNNKGNDFETMLNYINKDSANERNINSLSTKEITDFFDYAKNSGYMHTQSNADEDYYKSYFATVSNGTADKELNSQWGNSIFDSATYQTISNSYRTWKA